MTLLTWATNSFFRSYFHILSLRQELSFSSFIPPFQLLSWHVHWMRSCSRFHLDHLALNDNFGIEFDFFRSHGKESCLALICVDSSWVSTPYSILRQCWKISVLYGLLLPCCCERPVCSRQQWIEHVWCLQGEGQLNCLCRKGIRAGHVQILVVGLGLLFPRVPSSYLNLAWRLSRNL